MKVELESVLGGRGRHCGSGIFLLLSMGVLAGCSSGSSDNTTPPPPPPPPDPVAETPPLAATAVSLDGGPTIGSAHWPEGDTSSGGLGQDVDGLECIYPSPVAYHVHTHLTIYLNEEALTIPEHVGIPELTPTTECHYPLHTHDESGLIHVHATMPTDFTLGQFFDIWGQSLGPDDVAGLMNLPTTVYITDGEDVTTYEGDFRDIQLVTHREITIQLGTAITEIPRYAWTGM